MIIGDIRFIEITTLSSRLCVLTGGAFLVVFRSRLTAAFFFFYTYGATFSFCAPHVEEEKRKAEIKQKKRKVCVQIYRSLTSSVDDGGDGGGG